MNKSVKALIFWTVIVVSALLLWQVVKAGNPAQADPEISYSRFLSQVAEGQVSKVTIAGGLVRGADPKGNKFRVIAPPNQSTMIEALEQHGVEIWFKETSEGGWPMQLMGTWAPLILLAALWFFMIRQMQTANRRRSAGQASSSPESPTRFGP